MKIHLTAGNVLSWSSSPTARSSLISVHKLGRVKKLESHLSKDDGRFISRLDAGNVQLGPNFPSKSAVHTLRSIERQGSVTNNSTDKIEKTFVGVEVFSNTDPANNTCVRNYSPKRKCFCT